MKRREQAVLLLRKAAEDEALLDQVLTASEVSDEIIGFHYQQAAEKRLKSGSTDLPQIRLKNRAAPMSTRVLGP